MATALFIDKVWIDEDRKLGGLCADLLDAVANGGSAVIVAHFDESLTSILMELRARSIQFRVLMSGESPALCSTSAGSGSARVWLAHARHFEVHNIPAGERNDAHTLRVLIVEHHPMASADKALVDAITELPCRSSVIFHTALTDPLMVHFGGDRLQELVRSLGDENDCISHPMVTASIQRAQQKIEKSVRREIEAQSAEEWFRFNLYPA